MGEDWLGLNANAYHPHRGLEMKNLLKKGLLALSLLCLIAQPVTGPAFASDKIARGLAIKAVTPKRNQVRPYVSNLTPANLAKFHTQFQRLLNGNDKFLYVDFFGDSQTLTTGGNVYTNSIPAFYATKLRTLAGPISPRFDVSDNKFGVYSTVTATETFDPRWSHTGTVDGWQALPGGQSFRITSNAGQIKYSPGVSYDTMNLIWFRDTTANLGGGTMTITVDGGATNFTCVNGTGSAALSCGGTVSTFTTSQTGAQSLQSLVITIASAGVHTVEVTNGATLNTEIFGFEAYTAARPTIFVRTMGFSGYTSVNYVANSIPVRMYDAALTAHLSFFCLGDNDSLNLVSRPTYRTNITTLKGSLTALSSASIVAWTWPPATVATMAMASQQNYVDDFNAQMGTDVVSIDEFKRGRDLGGAEGTPAEMNGTIHWNAWRAMGVASEFYDATVAPIAP